MTSACETYRIEVHGYVHGVGFRYALRKRAKEFGIFGSVRNTNNGKVEIYLLATAAELEHILHWCARGPRGARVDAVSVEKVSMRRFDDFSIIQ